MSQKLPDRAFVQGSPSSSFLLEIAAGKAMTDRDVRLSPIVVEQAHRHGLIPLMAEFVDDPVVHAIRVREGVRRRILEKHLARLLSRFQTANIPVAVLKGPIVAQSYRNPSHRSFSDLDLLVPEEFTSAALELLASDPASVRVPDKGPKADKREVLFRDDAGVLFNVDLHWNLFSYSQLRGLARGAMDSAWSKAYLESDAVIGSNWVLPFGVKVGFLATHAILDHRFRLILYRDILEIARSPADWDDVVEVAATFGLRHVTYVSLWIARESLGAEIPAEVLSRLRPDSALIRYLEWALPRIDIVQFNGGRIHPVNLACVLMNDSKARRWWLSIRAPFAFRGWKHRVADRQSKAVYPRVLIVVASDSRREAEVFAERLKRGLMQRGILTEAVGLTTSGAPVVTQIETITRLAPSEAGKFSFRVALALRRKIRQLRPNMVLTIGPTLRYGLLATFRSGVKLGYLAIGEPLFWLRSRFRALVHRVSLRPVNRVFAESNMTRRQLEELEPSLKGRVEVVFTGVEETPLPEPSNAKGPLRVLMVGALSYKKNPLAALEVLARVPDAVLRFVGAGELEEAVRRQARAWDVDDRVEVVGPPMEVTEHFAWAEVLLLTSRSEGLPGVVLEAAMMEVPCVAFDVGGVAEAIVDRQTGVLVQSGDIDGMAGVLRELAANREEAVVLGKAARFHVRSSFDIEQIIDEYERVIRSTVAQP